jgi:galactan endo-1,6-beta-galactosidase
MMKSNSRKDMLKRRVRYLTRYRLFWGMLELRLFMRKLAPLLVFSALISLSYAKQRPKGASRADAVVTPVLVDPSQDLGAWQGWGSSLAWWGRAVGGTQNADYFADLIYSTRPTDGFPGLGLNIVRYNVGGGGINQAQENKGPKLQWQMDIHGYWTDPDNKDPQSWNWSVDQNQRAMMQKARDRGANIFEMFSDSPMWWMNRNRSTAGSETGGDCLLPHNYDRFAFYLASVAKHAKDSWGITFNSVEPFNEPSADWWKYPSRQEGCHLDVAAQQLVVQRLRPALDDAGLQQIAVVAADENNMDAGLNTWNAYDAATRGCVGRVNVHGYSNGTAPYRGPNRAELRRVVGNKQIFLSEYGDGDASGYLLAQQIIRDVKELQPSAWIYWQPVEPDAPAFGWGLINANYVDTHDRLSAEKTTFVRVNRKFFVFGQFTRYVRAGYRLIEIADPNSIAAYDPTSHTLVIVKVTYDSTSQIKFDLSRFSSVGNTAEMFATTTVPGGDVPDWQQHGQILPLNRNSGRTLMEMSLHPKSVYTFVVQGVLR